MGSLMMNSMRARPDAVVGKEAGLEGEIGVAEVDHDVRSRAARSGSRSVRGRPRTAARPRRRVPTSPSAQDTVTVCAVAQRLGRVLRADHGRDAELARDDGGVAGAAAAVGDDRRRRLHHRLPVGRRGVGDQHLARPEVGRARARRAITRTGPVAILAADRAAGREHLALALAARRSRALPRRRCEATVSGRACTM